MRDCGQAGHNMASVILLYSDWRLERAYCGVELTAEDIVEMQRRCIEGNKEWKRRKNKIENVGEVLDEVQVERGRKSAEKFRRKSKWMKRELSDADQEALKMAWSS